MLPDQPYVRGLEEPLCRILWLVVCYQVVRLLDDISTRGAKVRARLEIGEFTISACRAIQTFKIVVKRELVQPQTNTAEIR